MKKVLLIAVALMATLTMSAQGMFIKPMVGGTLATLSGDGTDDAKMKIGLAAGAEFGYQVMDPLAITAGALISMQGTGYKDHGSVTDASFSSTYLNIPIMANYQIIPGLSVKAGVQPGFLLSVKNKYSAGGHDYESTETDGYKKFDFSIPFGLSYEISDFVIDARYNLGLSNIYDTDSDHKIKNSVIMLTLGYKIPF